MGRLRRRGDVATCPPPRAGRRVETLEDWCPAHGREDLLEEWDDPSKGAHEVTRGSKEKVWGSAGRTGAGTDGAPKLAVALVAVVAVVAVAQRARVECQRPRTTSRCIARSTG